ncbi:MAG: class I SAM-dependent methyltransferase [Bacteroidetes bacterium]|nr:class I SAM-dependent methyltransferase [Bacteroidota bacterium]
MKTPAFVSKILIRRGFERLRLYLDTTREEKWNSERVIDFLFSKQGELIRPWQFREEMEQLAALIEEIKPAVAVEIGTANGGTLFMTARLSAPDAILVSIDLPEGPYGGGYPESKVLVYRSFSCNEQKIELVRDDSHTEKTFEGLKKNLDGKKIDYLFIDGDHSYDGVKKDFEMYSALVRPGGWVAFHDIVVHPDETTNVYKFWAEIKKNYEHREFVKDWNQKRFGIGVLKMK